jgi:hypothetical protein
MDTKTPWWHKFMTKECILAALAGITCAASFPILSRRRRTPSSRVMTRWFLGFRTL